MIRLKNFSIGFKERNLLHNISTEFPSGKLTALIGRNGSGKSTLLKALSGLNKDYKGDIIIDNENLKDISTFSLAKKLAYVNTHRPGLRNLKCIDVVKLGRSPHTGWYGKLSSADKRIIEEAIAKVGMQDYIMRHFNNLSDGESQKIMIARAIAQDTPVILLDEPTSFLDLPTRYELVALLKELSEDTGKTIIFSTHELDVALKYANQIALIDTPNLISLPTEDMIKSNHITRLFNI